MLLLTMNPKTKEIEDDKSEDSLDDIFELVDENDAEAPAWDGELEDSDSTEGADEVQSSSKNSEASLDEESENVEDTTLGNSGSASTKSEAPPDEEPESVEDDALSNPGSTTNNPVLEEYISYVRTILDQLTRISLTIRRAGAKYR